MLTHLKTEMFTAEYKTMTYQTVRPQERAPGTCCLDTHTQSHNLRPCSRSLRPSSQTRADSFQSLQTLSSSMLTISLPSSIPPLDVSTQTIPSQQCSLLVHFLLWQGSLSAAACTVQCFTKFLQFHSSLDPPAIQFKLGRNFFHEVGQDNKRLLTLSLFKTLEKFLCKKTKKR